MNAEQCEQFNDGLEGMFDAIEVRNTTLGAQRCFDSCMARLKYLECLAADFREMGEIDYVVAGEIVAIKRHYFSNRTPITV